MNEAIAAPDVLKTLNWLKTQIGEAGGEATITESGGDNNGWYRKWSNGWIEQGGYRYWGINKGFHVETLTLTKAFTETNYFICGISYWGSTTSEGTTHIAEQTKTTAKICVCGSGIVWYACGY